MRLSFHLNWMGVINMSWYERNNIPFTERTIYMESLGKEFTVRDYETYYSCGRIDVYGHPDYPFNYEYGVNIMDNLSWYRLGNWIDDLVLDYLPESVEEIYEMFENDTGHKINWFKEYEH